MSFNPFTKSTVQMQNLLKQEFVGKTFDANDVYFGTGTYFGYYTLRRKIFDFIGNFLKRETIAMEFDGKDVQKINIIYVLMDNEPIKLTSINIGEIRFEGELVDINNNNLKKLKATSVDVKIFNEDEIEVEDRIKKSIRMELLF